MDQTYAEGLPIAAMAVGICIGFAIGMAIMAVIAFIVKGMYDRIPAEHREMDPVKVWLLVIPLFSLYWNFVVFLGMSRSFQRYFASQGVTDVGDCGFQMAKIYCILAVVSAVVGFIPVIGCIGTIGSLAALVLLIVMLVKFHELRNRIPAGPTVV